ncbi:BMP family ABC transporter substrate-binding protein [Catellatospora methionotrophica]|uniref:BMP family ABC transporter substrate-binding protein n=2 Tax=Catellatospora methionotrophica TaxID=121620 RepID=A0A8J3L7X7_9ACTN|nr:BMP family ABC transporter substrate-binding protein [Catellatospora methionotrophica]
MRPVRGMKIVALVASAGLAFAAAACAKPTEETPGTGTSAAAKYSACMVTDTGGIDDHSFNASSWAGLQAAKAANPAIDPSYTASTAMADYDPNLANSVTKGCKYIQAVGGLMGDATKKAATANATTQFSIVDADNLGLANVYPIQFQTQQAAYLAGYLAAGYSKSGKVGTYGGMKIPPVTIFMDGFADGVAAYNTAKGKSVQVLGWDKVKQDGLFTDDFGSQDKGKQKSDTLAAQGADVIFPVAGGAGLGSAANAGSKFVVIWVDADGFETTKYGSVMLTTVVKNSTDGVKEAVTKAAGTPGTLLTGGFMGTLANNGVSLAPYHDFDSKIDAGLKAEVEALKQDIISGKIKVESPAQPK